MQVPPEINSIADRVRFQKDGVLYASRNSSLTACKTVYETYVKCMQEYKKIHYPFDIASIHGYYTPANPENQEKINCIIKARDTNIFRGHTFEEHTL
jgi:hypothetical protein